MTYPDPQSTEEWLNRIEQWKIQVHQMHQQYGGYRDKQQVWEAYQRFFADRLAPAYMFWLDHQENPSFHSKVKHDVSQAYTVLDNYTSPTARSWFIENKTSDQINDKFGNLLSTVFRVWESYLFFQKEGVYGEVPLRRVLTAAINTQSNPKRIILEDMDEATTLALNTFIHRPVEERVNLFFMWRNLIQNALKYSPPGTPVRVIVEFLDRSDSVLPNHGLKFTVADEGIGIPQDEIALVLNGHRASNAVQSGIYGTGFGLETIANMVKKLEREGASITIQSRTNPLGAVISQLPDALSSPLQKIFSKAFHSGTTIAVIEPLMDMMLPFPFPAFDKFCEELREQLEEASAAHMDLEQWSTWYQTVIIKQMTDGLRVWKKAFVADTQDAKIPSALIHEVRGALSKPIYEKNRLQALSPSTIEPCGLYEEALESLLDAQNIVHNFLEFYTPNQHEISRPFPASVILSRAMESFKSMIDRTSPHPEVVRDLLINKKMTFDLVKPHEAYLMIHTLLDNAYKYSFPASQKIQVIASIVNQPEGRKASIGERSYLKLEIIDAGRGIPEIDRERVHHGHRGTNVDDIEGTGQGLKQCARILSQYQSKQPNLPVITPITLETAYPGAENPGTRATLILPLKAL